jgi:dienelactone hydrolase
LGSTASFSKPAEAAGSVDPTSGKEENVPYEGESMPAKIRIERMVLVAVLLCSSGIIAQQNRPAMPPQPSGPLVPAVLKAKDAELVLRDGLACGLIGSYGRSAVPSDLLAWQIATGAFRTPKEGAVLGKDARGREQAWTRVQAGEDGWIQNRALSGGYFYAAVDSERARTMILDASGYYGVRINGEPRGGEKYGADWVRHPVLLKKGRNEFLFQGERGRLRARLFEPPAPAFFTDKDPTLPDLIVGDAAPVRAGLRLVNATADTLTGIKVVYASGGVKKETAVDMTVPPRMTRKLAILFDLGAAASEGPVKLTLRAAARAGRKSVETPAFDLELKAVAPTAHQARTFLSAIDGSVQVFGVAPWTGEALPADMSKPALFLTLHGAGVEAIGQARAYKPKSWGYVIAATNRRPYGFDWEDWGRLDAVEVMNEASRLFGTDPTRTYLTGHSMGGHGTWQIGATFPDLWAAIAPSAGWTSFSTYGGGQAIKESTPVEKILVRANNPGETAELQRNFLDYGVFILHGDKDDNVPVSQARAMREMLGKFHPDFTYYERPGAGHWWGDECVDWPPLFAFLRLHTKPADADVRRVEFVTANPGISSRNRWLTVHQQIHPLEYSKAAVDRDEKGRAYKGTTENIALLSIDVIGAAAGETAVFELDGGRVEAKVPGANGRVFLAPGKDGWSVGPPPDAGAKNPTRSGGFKDVFRNNAVLVFGTLGDAAEDARAFQKARFDAEMFWVRGNGSFDLVPDTDFVAAKFKDRNIILYGNADTNAAWKTLLAASPVQFRAGRADVGAASFSGPDLAGTFIRPRPDSDTASVGAVAWTGPAGWTAAGPGQYFISGAGFPDVLVFSAEIFRSGTDGVRAVGWFGNDWGFETGEFVLNEGSRTK